MRIEIIKKKDFAEVVDFGENWEVFHVSVEIDSVVVILTKLEKEKHWWQR